MCDEATTPISRIYYRFYMKIIIILPDLWVAFARRDAHNS